MSTATARAAFEDAAELLRQLDELRITCQRQRNELAVLKGEKLEAARGASIARIIVGDAWVPVEFDYQPEEAAVFDLNSPMCGPGCAEVIEPTVAYINGKWVDIDDLLSTFDPDALIQTIADERAAQDKADLEAYYEDRGFA